MVSVDAVYQKVLAIANKEQRGYITPQEFNLFASQAQQEIFEQYFYDVDQLERRMGNDTVKLIKTKIEIFKRFATVNMHGDLPVDTHHVETVILYIDNSNNPLYHDGHAVVAEKLDRDDNYNIHRSITESYLLRPNASRPVYWIVNNVISYAPHPDTVGGHYEMGYIKYPQSPNWTYVVDSSTGSALYNPSSVDHRDFEVHRSEENKLVTKILLLAGVSMKDVGLAQLAGQKEASITQQQKQ